MLQFHESFNQLYVSDFFLKLGGPGTRRRIDAVSMLTLSDTSLNYIEELNNEEKNFEPSFSLVINGHSLVCKKKLVKVNQFHRMKYQ